MATFIDVSGLAAFSNIFVFIFVWLVIYAILKTTKVFGEKNDAINIIIGLVIALLVLFSPVATGIVQLISPWFAIVFIFIIFATIAFKIMGVDYSDIIGSKSLGILLGVIIIIIIIVGALAYTRQQVEVPGDNETEAEYDRPGSALFHPTVLGGILILLIAVFTVALMTGKTK